MRERILHYMQHHPPSHEDVHEGVHADVNVDVRARTNGLPMPITCRCWTLLRMMPYPLQVGIFSFKPLNHEQECLLHVSSVSSPPFEVCLADQETPSVYIKPCKVRLPPPPCASRESAQQAPWPPRDSRYAVDS